MKAALARTLEGFVVPSRLDVFTLPEIALELIRQQAQRGVREVTPNYSAAIATYWLAQDPPVDIRRMEPRPPWCMALQRWAWSVGAELLEVPDPLSLLHRGMGALVQELYDTARAHGWIVEAHEARAGDLVVYAWHRVGHYDHVGAVESGPGYTNTFATYEGNTPPMDDGDQRGGSAAAVDGVYPKRRRMSVGNPRFIRPVLAGAS